MNKRYLIWFYLTPICLYCSKEISEKEIEEYEKFGENRDKLNKKDILTEDNGKWKQNNLKIRRKTWLKYEKLEKLITLEKENENKIILK